MEFKTFNSLNTLNHFTYLDAKIKFVLDPESRKTLLQGTSIAIYFILCHQELQHYLKVVL